MNIKSLLLGSAAALVAVTGARAADAIDVVAEPEPMEYVRVCDVYGAGFYYIPGTETCLRVSGYMRYDIGVGDLFGVEDFTSIDADGDETYYKRARFQLRVDARSETELGTLRAYLAYNMNYIRDEAGDDDSASIEHAYIELGGFRIGATDSMFSTFTGYAGGVINDDLVSYGPFKTHQIAYTFNAGNGFTAAVALEEGSGDFVLDDYVPHVVAGVGYTGGWGGVSGVVGYDSVVEEWAAKARLDVNATDAISLFVMGGWKSGGGDTFVVDGRAFDENPQYYGNWAGDWAVWGGGSFKVNEKATINAQLSYDEGENFAAVANVAYELVPGFVITPEVAYFDNFDDDDLGDDDDGAFGGWLRFQRNF